MSMSMTMSIVANLINSHQLIRFLSHAQRHSCYFGIEKSLFDKSTVGDGVAGNEKMCFFESFDMVIRVADTSMSSCGCWIGMNVMHEEALLIFEILSNHFWMRRVIKLQKYDPIQACTVNERPKGWRWRESKRAQEFFFLYSFFMKLLISQSISVFIRERNSNWLYQFFLLC